MVTRDFLANCMRSVWNAHPKERKERIWRMSIYFIGIEHGTGEFTTSTHPAQPTELEPLGMSNL